MPDVALLGPQQGSTLISALFNGQTYEKVGKKHCCHFYSYEKKVWRALDGVLYQILPSFLTHRSLGHPSVCAQSETHRGAVWAADLYLQDSRIPCGGAEL